MYTQYSYIYVWGFFTFPCPGLMNHILSSNGIHQPSCKGMVMFRGSRPAAIWRQYLTGLALCPSSSSYVTWDIRRAEVPHSIQLFNYSILPLFCCGINVPHSEGKELPSSLCCATCMGNDSGISSRWNNCCGAIGRVFFSSFVVLGVYEHLCSSTEKHSDTTVGSFLQSARSHPTQD